MSSCLGANEGEVQLVVEKLDGNSECVGERAADWITNVLSLKFGNMRSVNLRNIISVVHVRLQLCLEPSLKSKSCGYQFGRTHP
jgi:hypothetical protein